MHYVTIGLVSNGSRPKGPMYRDLKQKKTIIKFLLLVTSFIIPNVLVTNVITKVY